MKAVNVLIVLLSAVLTAGDAVLTGAMMSAFHVGPLVATALSTFVAGAILLVVSYRNERDFYKKLDRGSIVKLLMISFVGAIAIFAWFDSVSRIGAGKEMLLSGSTFEILFIMLLSFVFLNERLVKSEIIGSVLVLLGIFIISFNPQTVSFEFGLGEFEAVISSMLFATSIVMTADVLRKLNAQEVGALTLMTEGMLILMSAYVFESPAGFTTNVIVASIAIGFVSSMAVLTYNTGLKLAGALLTSVVSSFTGLFTVGMEFLAAFLLPSVAFVFPSNIPMAIAGGMLAVFGVFLISYKSK